MIEWVLVVLIVADGRWLDWEHTYARKSECEEVAKIITYRREDTIQARCEARAKNGS